MAACRTKVAAIFRNLARAAAHPKWKGCGFLRTSAELANLPGHPAIRIGAAHKKKFEGWLRATFEAEGIAPSAPSLPGSVCCCSTAAFAVVLLHRDPSYMETAGQAARSPDRGRDAGSACANEATVLIEFVASVSLNVHAGPGRTLLLI